MTEPPATAPSGIAASQRDVLLATKLHIPASRPDLVPRPRLTERLDESLARGLVLVCAPAGYGKTVLLADWAWRHENPAAWLSLDDGDNDPARFWRHAVAALDRARPGISERVAPLLGPPAPSSFQGLVTALINDLAAEPGTDDALLVLDDYHVIGSQPVHESLAFLVEHRPAGICVVLASRTGSHRYVLDYLAEEVLERQSEQLRTFLLETSVLERLSGELLGKLGAANRTEAVARARELSLIP